MSDVPTATKIAALEDRLARLAEEHSCTVRILAAERDARSSLLDENIRLKNSALIDRYEIESLGESNDKLRETIESVAKEINDACVDTKCSSIYELSLAINDRNAYAERLLAENVRLSNEAAELREAHAEVACENARLTNDVGVVGNRLSMEQEDHAATKATLESLRHSVYAACAGSGCLNAHELRVALDRERELANRLDNDRAHMTLRFTEEATAHVNTLKELGRERERCFVLEREVLKWRYAEYISRAIENAAYLDTERHELNAARTETDTRHALDAAKFVGGGQ